MLSRREAAKALTVTVDVISFLVNSGELNAVNVARKSTGRPLWRFELEELERFKRSRSTVLQDANPRRKPRRDTGQTKIYV